MKLILLFILQMYCYQSFGQLNLGATRYYDNEYLDYSLTWQEEKSYDTIVVTILENWPVRILCGDRAWAAVTIASITRYDTIRILSLCEMSVLKIGSTKLCVRDITPKFPVNVDFPHTIEEGTQRRLFSKYNWTITKTMWGRLMD